MTDTYTKHIPLVGGIEVKTSGGSSLEASVQLGIWSAAGLQKARLLQRERQLMTAAGPSDRDARQSVPSQENEQLPFFGWTIVGHEWKLYITWKDVIGEVVSHVNLSSCRLTYHILILHSMCLGRWRPARWELNNMLIF